MKRPFPANDIFRSHRREKADARSSTALYIGVPSHESGMGLPHSKTLARAPARHSVRKVVECGSPMPLFPVLVNTLNRTSRFFT